MYSIAVVGCGIVGNGHLEAIARTAELRLAAIVEADPARREEIARQYQVEYSFGDYRELLESVPLDAVVVATHAESHYEIAMAALRSGLHVLCEKPMAASTQECEAMCAEALRTGRLLAVNFNTRSSEPYLTIKQWIDSGELGTIRVVRFVYDWSAHQWQPPARLEKFMANGGPVIDSAVHFFEGVRWYTGAEFGHIDATGVVIAPYEHPQHVIANCRMTDGSIALVEAGWLFTKRTRDRGMVYNVTVIGDDGTVDYDYNLNLIKVWTKTQTLEIDCTDLDKHFEVVHAKFAASMQAGRLIELASGSDGLKATAAAYQALAAAHRSGAAAHRNGAAGTGS